MLETFAMHPVFLEADIRASWSALLALGDGDDNAAGELIEAMLDNCYNRAGVAGSWGKECDRALYMRAVLERVELATEMAGNFTRTTPVDDYEGDEVVDEERGGLLTTTFGSDNVVPRAEAIAVASEELSFPAFFLEYAVPRRAVIFPGEYSVAAGADNTDVDQSMTHGADGVAGAAAMAAMMDVVSTASGMEEEDSSSSSLVSSTNAAATAQDDIDHTSAARRRVLDLVTACVPYRVNDKTGYVYGPLRSCDEALLRTLVMPRYIAADFVQRFRASDALPVKDHHDVESFIKG